MGRVVWLWVLCALLAACGETSRNGASDAASPVVAPRWLALHSAESLRIVRFDHVTAPEEVTLSLAADGEHVDSERVYWSPSGEHLAFVTDDADRNGSLWLASAQDGFARRAVNQPAASGSELVSWGPVPTHRTLVWIGPSAFVLRVPTGVGIDFYRVAVDDPLPELLGSFADEVGDVGSAFDNALAAASRFGFLFSAGSPSQADLLFATESGPVQRLGKALLGSGDQVRYSAAELVWAPDGQSANFWTNAISTWYGSTGLDLSARQFRAPDTEAPPLDIDAEARPRIGLVHLPAGLLIDQDPHGTLAFGYEYGGRALAPGGAAVAYTLRHQRAEPMYQLIAGVPEPTLPAFGIEGGLGHDSPPQFGFLDASTLYYPKFVPADASSEGSVRCIVRRGDEERVISVDRNAPDYFAPLPGSQRMFFVRVNPAGVSELYFVDLADRDAMAELVPLPGSVLYESVLPQGHTWKRGYHAQGGSDAGDSLLLSTSTAKEECLDVGKRCETQRFVVELSSGAVVRELQPRWLYAALTWAVDGSGLLAVDEQGLSFIPGPSFDGAFSLSAERGTTILPDRWPAR